MEDQELTQIIEEFAPSIYRLAYARTASHADAEDVMQEVFLRLLRKRPSFHDREHCRAWLLRVTVNCVNDLFRTPWRRRTVPLEEARKLPSPEPGGALEEVLNLPEKYRIPVHLFYYEGFSVAEIASILHTSQGAVKTRLSRARSLLRERMKGEEDHA